MLAAEMEARKAARASRRWRFWPAGLGSANCVSASVVSSPQEVDASASCGAAARAACLVAVSAHCEKQALIRRTISWLAVMERAYEYRACTHIDSATQARICQLSRSCLMASSSWEAVSGPATTISSASLAAELLRASASSCLSRRSSSIMASAAALCSSRLATSLFLMVRALDVYLRVLRVSSMLLSDGLTQAIMTVRELPPRLSCSRRVSLWER
mmetsp:Transcript_30934/g.87625  ORF Transcript_30934/g.87625 Transcript_30934/m.87625 type:complete len:216 (-) Transcript_30934:673-1320(-)